MVKKCNSQDIFLSSGSRGGGRAAAFDDRSGGMRSFDGEPRRWQERSRSPRRFGKGGGDYKGKGGYMYPDPYDPYAGYGFGGKGGYGFPLPYDPYDPYGAYFKGSGKGSRAGAGAPDDPYKNFGSSRYSDGKGGGDRFESRGKGGKGKGRDRDVRKGGGKGGRRKGGDDPTVKDSTTSEKLDSELDAYFNGKKAAAPEKAERSGGGKSGGKGRKGEKAPVDESALDAELENYMGKDKEPEKEGKTAAAKDATVDAKTDKAAPEADKNGKDEKKDSKENDAK